ncbi:MAG: alpha amylase family protein [Armatimonadota bacterium]
MTIFQHAARLSRGSVLLCVTAGLFPAATAAAPPAKALPVTTKSNKSVKPSLAKKQAPIPVPVPSAPVPTAPQAMPTQPPAPLPGPISVLPPAVVPSYVPFPRLAALAPVVLDEARNGIGIAQQMTRERGYQGRVLWIDATANIDRYNTAEKISSLVAKIKSVGFNTIVLDVKPIIGFTIYPSKFAPKLTEWVKPQGTQRLPLAFDPVREMTAQTRKQGINLILSMNAFSEGHRDFGKGPGYDHPEWQTTIYDVQLRVRREVSGAASQGVSDNVNGPTRNPDDLAVYTDLSRLKTTDPNTLIALLDAGGVVQAQIAASAMAVVRPTLPPGGAALVAATPQSVAFLRLNAAPAQKLSLESVPVFVPISQRPEKQVPLMVNPNNPDVRRRILEMIGEVALNYPADGIIFDDRLRYAGLNADFSPDTRQQFEQYVGKRLNWPDDIFRYQVNFPTMERFEVPGPYYDSWLTFRAMTLRNWLADAVRVAKTARPQMTVNTYVGSWYPDYPEVGANWAATDIQAGFRFLNDSYQQTGWAGLTSFVTTGCYYTTATIAEAAASNKSIGDSVEAAGQFSNRAVNDQAFVYAGISLDKFVGRSDQLRRVLQAAAASTQGVMVFDLSHNIDPFWPIFADAFSKPAFPPHAVPGLVEELRAKREAQKVSGAPTPPVVIYRGTSGTGF